MPINLSDPDAYGKFWTDIVVVGTVYATLLVVELAWIIALLYRLLARKP